MSEVTEYVATYQNVPDSLAQFIVDLQDAYRLVPEEHRAGAFIQFDEDGDYDVYYERPKTTEELKEDESRAAKTRSIRIQSALNVLKELNYEGDLNGNQS